jgi:hypothetical protein
MAEPFFLPKGTPELILLFCAGRKCFKHFLEESPAWWGAACGSPVLVDPVRFWVKCPAGRLRNGHFDSWGASGNGLQSALISGSQSYKAERLLRPGDRS